MLARALCLVALTGCFVPRTEAERPRVAAYNALVALGGAAMFGLGFKLARDAGRSDEDGLDGFGGVTLCTGGAILALAGLGGIAGAFLDPVKDH